MLVFHSQGALGSSKAGGLVSKAKAWLAASLGREQPGEAFPKGSACSWLALQLCPRVHQPPGHSAADTKSSLGGSSGGPTDGDEAGDYHETPARCLSCPGQLEHPRLSVASPVCNRGRARAAIPFLRRWALGDISPCSSAASLHKTCRRFLPWRPVTLSQWEGKAGNRLEMQDTRTLCWAGLTPPYWGVLGRVWGVGWVRGAGRRRAG